MSRGAPKRPRQYADFNVGSRVLYLRFTQDLSLADLSARTGFDISAISRTISRPRTGATTSLLTVEKYARAFGMTLAEFLASDNAAESAELRGWTVTGRASFDGRGQSPKPTADLAHPAQVKARTRTRIRAIVNLLAATDDPGRREGLLASLAAHQRRLTELQRLYPDGRAFERRRRKPVHELARLQDVQSRAWHQRQRRERLLAIRDGLEDMARDRVEAVLRDAEAEIVAAEAEITRRKNGHAPMPDSAAHRPLEATG